MTLKVTPGQGLNHAPKSSKKLSADEIAAKVASKFGKEAVIKKKDPPKPSAEVDTADIHSKETVAHGDIGKNDPNSELTREKLKGILKGGGFNFNDKERKALAQILK